MHWVMSYWKHRVIVDDSYKKDNNKIFSDDIKHNSWV